MSLKLLVVLLIVLKILLIVQGIFLIFRHHEQQSRKTGQGVGQSPILLNIPLSTSGLV
jgi:hypothetical protein